ncbi:Hint domain-containing protein [Jannaschia marina]|uniref:Hint domain-containing protein n=1 Tax=Jannaschia marina TaxID=2741674 RepID=UPI0015C6AA09|nr:Hint domain-containing protein [Jannaschia marina]
MNILPPPPAPLGVPVLADQSLRHALPAGSRILTAKGEVPVESVAAGDRVITRDHGMAVVREAIRVDAPRGAPMVRLPAHALGRGRPERDVLLPRDQPVVLRDWRAKAIFGAKEARVAAQRLVDGAIIRSDVSDGSALWCLVLDTPSALYVDGLELVSGALSAVRV